MISDKLDKVIELLNEKYKNKTFKTSDVLSLVQNIKSEVDEEAIDTNNLISELEWYKNAFRVLMYNYNRCSSCVHSKYKSNSWVCNIKGCVCGSSYECTKYFFENEFKQELNELPNEEDKYKLHSHQFNELDIIHECKVSYLRKVFNTIKEELILKDEED